MPTPKQVIFQLPKVTFLLSCGVWEQGCLSVVLVVLFHSVYQDLEAWHGDMQSRLRLIPDSSETLKYKPTCTAIQQLQVHQYMYTHSSCNLTTEVNGICVYLCAYVCI